MRRTVFTARNGLELLYWYAAGGVYTTSKGCDAFDAQT
jgi:hypothetical protein